MPSGPCVHSPVLPIRPILPVRLDPNHKCVDARFVRTAVGASTDEAHAYSSRHVLRERIGVSHRCKNAIAVLGHSNLVPDHAEACNETRIWKVDTPEFFHGCQLYTTLNLRQVCGNFPAAYRLLTLRLLRALPFLRILL
jgi:hypothetical protein